MPTFLDTNGHAHTLRDQDDVVLYDGERIPIMSNLSQIIKDWTKAVMVACPEDTLEFSRDYFAKLAMQGRQSRALVGETQGGSKLALSAGKVYRSLPVDMQERIEHIFMAFDAGESGSINKADVFDSLKQARARAEGRSTLGGQPPAPQRTTRPREARVHALATRGGRAPPPSLACPPAVADRLLL